jgi:putative peptidoglycan lipid II flippase
VGGWLLAVVADVVLSRSLPVEDRALALGAGHSLGVTVAGLGLLAVVARAAGPGALTGVVRAGVPAVAGAALGAVAALWAAAALGADPVPDAGVPAAIGVGVVAGGIVLVVAAAVMMGAARVPLTGALHALRAPDSRADRQEVHRG